MRNLPIASKAIYNKARKSFRLGYEMEQVRLQPYQVAVIHREIRAIVDEKYLDYVYEDVEFDAWIYELRELLNDEKKYAIALEKYMEEERKLTDKEIAREVWRVNLKDFEQNFAPWAVPKVLFKLAKYQNRRKRYLTHFYLTSEDYSANTVLFGDEKLAKQFVIFGCCDGNYFAYWKISTKITECPIVFIHHEIGGSRVLANNLKKFLQLVSDDDKWVLNYDDYTDETEDMTYYRDGVREQIEECELAAKMECKKNR